MRLLFLVCAFVSSSLLFVVEPMAAKMILPTFGGAPEVWNSAIFFFQTVLLLGYWYAHVSAKKLPTRTHPAWHMAVVLVAAAALPVSMHTPWFAHVQAWATQDRPPIPLVLLALAGLVGLPFFALSANSSTLQRWYSLSGRPDAAEPWFLYSAGNTGSMIALLAYPVVIEPNLTLGQQGLFWSIGYLALFALLAVCAACTWRFQRSPSTAEDQSRPTPKPSRRTKWLWLALAAVPSSLLLGVTTFLTSNIAPIPLLWVVPLALYLLTFILVFAKKPNAPATVLGRLYPLVLTPLVLLIVLENTLPIFALAHLAVFFIACWMCHSRLALMKPGHEHLTEFYFYISLGGVLGGAFNSLLAPALFNTLAEYPAALVAAALLMPAIRSGRRNSLDFAYPAVLAVAMILLVVGARHWGLEAGPLRTFITIGLPAILCFLAVDRPLRFGLSIAAGFVVAAMMHVNSDGTVPFTARSFFGVHRILLTQGGRFHNLINGNTIHGVQDVLHPGVPLTYYYPSGPIGQVMQESPPKTAALIGLGVGSLAAYGHPGQRFTYYEIDPIVACVASNPRWFTFLRDTKAKVNIVLGDGRLELAKAKQRYDLIVLDAFSSDAIPMHLLTIEAIKMYLKHLTPRGMVAFHISNRYLDLEPILSAAARKLDIYGLSQDGAMTLDEKAAGAKDSVWVIMAPTEEAFQKIKIAWWSELDPTRDRAWTDDYSDLIEAFNPDR